MLALVLLSEKVLLRHSFVGQRADFQVALFAIISLGFATLYLFTFYREAGYIYTASSRILLSIYASFFGVFATLALIASGSLGSFNVYLFTFGQQLAYALGVVSFAAVWLTVFFRARNSVARTPKSKPRASA